jgi:hypothetical protein
MKCPHCLTAFHDKWVVVPLVEDTDGGWVVAHATCPECHRVIVRLLNGSPRIAVHTGRLAGVDDASQVLLVYPKGASRSACPNEVPASIAEDYKEACLVIADSPKASAALSRRCLQNVLREAAKVKPGDLFDEIQAVLDSEKLPSHISEGLDAVRAIGNFGAHPIKSTHSGEVIPVAPGEAEWNLDVLEALFDFYFVQPALLTAKRAALDKKLAEAGKRPVR